MADSATLPCVELVGGAFDGLQLHCSSKMPILFVRLVQDNVEAFDQPYVGCVPYFQEALSSDRRRFTFTAWINEPFRKECVSV